MFSSIHMDIINDEDKETLNLGMFIKYGHQIYHALLYNLSRCLVLICYNYFDNVIIKMPVWNS